ncbi:putative WbbU [Candidatus Contendobacter odensis Run_B_J11]|uniref:WbbU n=2 Tax=Candidatus Contendibacter odensensis TaxID=1400860 RepID=A0A7U7J4U2_9GAMM|nr:putative WbbU [Candidatus Contendobacter odensis Run_B_J11]
MKRPIVYAVVVTYYPQADTFLPLMNELVQQTDMVIIVDNTDASDDRFFEVLYKKNSYIEHINIIRLGKNFGIAAALNVGIEAAKIAGCTHVLLSDQDSLPDSKMVFNLLRAELEVSKTGVKVGAVGPTYTDLHTKITYPFQAQLPRHFFYGHQAPTPANPHVEALTLITSGTLIPIEVFQDVSLMREDFFIDQVDIEWCHRARSRGYHLFGTGYATMYQRMGESHLRVWYLRWRNESAYSPLRIYYRLRNYVALCRLEYIDWRWKLRSSWYSAGIVYTHVFFGANRLEALKMVLKGVWHGLCQKMGQYEG